MHHFGDGLNKLVVDESLQSTYFANLGDLIARK